MTKTPEHLRKFAKQLRCEQTEPETILWHALLNRRFGNYKFKRQVTIKGYIADVYCAEKKLIVELDGSQHGDAVQKDEYRTKRLEEAGYYVMRFWNTEIYWSLDGVLAKICGWLDAH